MILLVRQRLGSFPIVTFLWTRLAVFLFAAFAYLAVESEGRGPYGQKLPHRIGAGSGWAVDLWARWDSNWFLRIAHNGYATGQTRTAFFPLYPAMIRVLGKVFFHHYVLAGMVISLAATAVAAVLIFEIGKMVLDEEDAKRSIVYLLLFPTSLFLSAVYTEGLYLALAAATFFFALRKRWLWAGVVCGLALLTRSSAVMLIPALAIIAWHATDRRRALLESAICIPIGAIWPAFLWKKFGDPLRFSHVETTDFARHFGHAGPLTGIYRALDYGWKGIQQLFGGTGADYFPQATGHPPLYTAAINLEQLGFAILVIALGVIAWKRLGPAFGVFVLGSMILPLSTPTQDYPLLSMPRFALAAFPIFLAGGTLGRKRSVDTAIVACSALYLGIEIVRWVMYDWVS
jgi:hypothetical protein